MHKVVHSARCKEVDMAGIHKVEAGMARNNLVVVGHAAWGEYYSDGRYVALTRQNDGHHQYVEHPVVSELAV